jgi:hypothetical protein
MISTAPTITSKPLSLVFAEKKTFFKIYFINFTLFPSFQRDTYKVSPGNTCDVNRDYTNLTLSPFPLQNVYTTALQQIP